MNQAKLHTAYTQKRRYQLRTEDMAVFGISIFIGLALLLPIVAIFFG